MRTHNFDITKTKTHLIIKVPLSSVKDEPSEKEVLELVNQGLQEYSRGETQSFELFVRDKLPEHQAKLRA